MTLLLLFGASGGSVPTPPAPPSICYPTSALVARSLTSAAVVRLTSDSGARVTRPTADSAASVTRLTSDSAATVTRSSTSGNTKTCGLGP